MGVAAGDWSDDAVAERLWRMFRIYRRALFNKLYYSHQLSKFRWIDGGLEFLSLVSSGGSTWAIWKNPAGKSVWMFVALVGALSAILRRSFGVHKNVERYSRLVTGHTSIYYSLEKILADVKINRALDRKMWDAFQQQFATYEKLAHDDDPKPKSKLSWQLYTKVAVEIPDSELWLPPISPKAKTASTNL